MIPSPQFCVGGALNMVSNLRLLNLGIILTFLLSACGGSGGGGGGTTNHAPVLSAVSNVSMVAGNNQTISLTATDQDNDAVSFNISGGSALTVSAAISGNSLTITPATGYVTASPITFTATASDGKGGTDSKTFSVTVTTQTKAILIVSTANIPAGTLVGAVQISIALPTGVTPSVVTGNDASGSVNASGNASSGSLALSTYDVATRTLTPGTISGAGFVSGEFLTITCSIAPGTTVSATDFPPQATVIVISDLSGNSIPGATSPISLTFQ